MTTTTKSLEANKHPPSLWCVSLICALFMAAFGGTQTTLVLYMNESFGEPLKHVYTVYAVFASLLFTLPLIGGYLSGKFGHKQSTGIGLLVTLVSMFCLLTHSLVMLYIGLAAFNIGNAFFTPGTYCLIDHCYKKDDARRESGFTLFYLFFNIGAVFGIFMDGYIDNHLGYSAAFLANGVYIALAALLYFSQIKRLQFEATRSLAAQWRGSKLKRACIQLGIVLIALPGVYLLYSFPFVNKVSLLVLVVFSVAYLIKLAKKQQALIKRYHVYGFLLLTAVSIVFWSLYNLEPSLLSVFAEHNVVRVMFGLHVPAESFMGFEAIFVVILGIGFSRLWWYLGQQQKDPSLAHKFSLSLLGMGIGFLYLFGTMLFVSLSHALPMVWMVFAYAFFASAELLVGPLGISMAGRLSPQGSEGFFMGFWQLVVGFSALVGGWLAQFAATPNGSTVAQTNPIYEQLFLHIGLVTVSLGVIFFILSPRLKRLL